MAALRFWLWGEIVTMSFCPLSRWVSCLASGRRYSPHISWEWNSLKLSMLAVPCCSGAAKVYQADIDNLPPNWEAHGCVPTCPSGAAKRVPSHEWKDAELQDLGSHNLFHKVTYESTTPHSGSSPCTDSAIQTAGSCRSEPTRSDRKWCCQTLNAPDWFRPALTRAWSLPVAAPSWNSLIRKGSMKRHFSL